MPRLRAQLIDENLGARTDRFIRTLRRKGSYVKFISHVTDSDCPMRRLLVLLIMCYVVVVTRRRRSQSRLIS